MVASAFSRTRQRLVDPAEFMLPVLAFAERDRG